MERYVTSYHPTGRPSPPPQGYGGGTGSTLRVQLAAVVLGCALGVHAQPNPARDLVNPFIGTGSHGHTFPGACVPNGLVQLSPDTRPDGYNDRDGCNGYHYSDSVIYGFSHTHLSGTDVADLCDVLLMPMSGGYSLDPEEYRSFFRKETEQAHAGYYTVHLDGPDVRAELTATKRVGVHRYTFPSDKEQWLIANLTHREEFLESELQLVSPTEVVGHRRSTSWAHDQQLFFCIQFNKPALTITEGAGEWFKTKYGGRQAPIKNPSKTHAAWRFGPADGTPLIVKVGISAVSIEGARKNLDAEVSHWDFDLVRKQAEDAWNAKLNKVQVSPSPERYGDQGKGGTREQQRIFYTALYHTYIAPYIFNDVDGQYRGMDGEVHTADHDVYTVFSLWDTFRSLHPLMTILEPDMVRDWTKTFLLHYQQSGRLPVWELWGNGTDRMIGYHSVSVIADAYLKGIRGFDAELALEAMVASAEQDHFGLDAYKRRGYISSEDEPESVSRTLEYAYDDWCIARMAEALGKQDIADRFFTRSRNWQNLFDPETGFFRPRRNGGFIESFDPHEVNFHFTEANAWQYSLFVPHDMERFMGLLGNDSGLTERLDALFTASGQTSGRDPSDIIGTIGRYAHGNKPGHSYAYLYTRSSRPFSTEVYVSKIMRELYHDAPDGLAGNEGHGQLSAWYALSALGLYPVTPGLPEYALGIPLFDEAVVDVGGGRTLRITGASESDHRAHVVTTTWNGEEHDRFRVIDHSDLALGGHLDFELGPRPGSAPSVEQHEERAGEVAWVPVPIIQAPVRSFADELLVHLACSDAEATLQYRPDTAAWKTYAGPITLSATTRLEARAIRLGVYGRTIHSNVVDAQFTKVDGAYSIILHSTFAPEHAADGAGSLLDGFRGGTDFRTGNWQGFRDQDIVTSIDLGSPKRVKRLGVGVLQDVRNGIWYPVEVEFATSTNGRQWSSAIVRNMVSAEAEGAQAQELWTAALDKRARYIEVTVRSIGPCPEWHPKAGEASWLFADEILIEAE